MSNSFSYISIVVPTYNVEKFLAKCLDSLLDQSTQKYSIEVLLVNDGSTDNSLSIANTYANRHSNIKIITQENKGLSEARNTGLRNANGTYIWFIDSDDWIETNCIEHILDLMTTNHLDVLAIGRHKVLASGSKALISTGGFKKGQIIDGKTCLGQNAFQIPSQLYVYRKEFLLSNNLRFPPGLFHEDKYFTPIALYHSKRMMFYDKAVYYHLQRQGSITAQGNPKRCFDLIQISNMLSDFVVTNRLVGELANVFHLHAFFTLTLSSLIAETLSNTSVKNEVYGKLAANKKPLLQVLKDARPIYRIEALVFAISPKFFSKGYNFIKSSLRNK